MESRCAKGMGLMLVVLLAGCATQKSESVQTHAGEDGAWRLVAGQVDGRRFPNVERTTLMILDRELHGRAACNQYGGNLAVGQGRWRITDGYATEIACSGLRAVSERSYFSALWTVTSARRDGADELALRGGPSLLKFRPVRALSTH